MIHTVSKLHRSQLFLTLISIGFFGATIAGAATTEKTFEVSPGGQLLIDSDIGSIKVSTGSESKVQVEIKTSGSAAEKFQPTFSQEGDKVIVRGEYEGNRWMGWLSQPKVEIIVRAPKQFDVELRTAGGSISVDDLEGEVFSRTSGGSLNFGNIHGPVRGETSGGSIRLDGSVGNADLSTSGGSIRIGDVNGDVRAETSGGSIQIERAQGSVEAETSGGSIRVQEVMGTIQASTSGGGIEAYISEQPQGKCHLTTSGGGITAYLDAGLDVDLEARASGGGVSTNLPFDSKNKRKGVLIGQLNGGGSELFLRTSGGKIRVLER